MTVIKDGKNDKVISFERDAAFYYRLYTRSAEDGNLYDAVFYLKKAAQSEDGDSEHLVELAKTYSQLMRYEQSNAIYFKLLAQDKQEGKSYFGLSQNLYYLNDIEHSVYYLNLYMDKFGEEMPFADDDEDYIEVSTEVDEFAGYKIVHPPQRRDETELLTAARDYMRAGLFAKATELLVKVKKGNPDYVYARNNLALCHFFMSDYRLTQHYCEEILQIEPQNVFALCTLAAMFEYVGDKKNTQKYVDIIISVDTEELPDLFKIATTLCELKRHDLALKYLVKLLKLKPYDYNIMFLAAIAYYNNHMPDKAQDMFLKLLRLDGDDYAVKYYIDYIDTVKKEKDQEKGFFQPLEYICQVPYGEMIEGVKHIKDMLKLTKAQAQKLGQEQYQKFLQLCDWSFSVTDTKFKISVINALTDKFLSRQSIEFLHEQLLSQSVSAKVKQVIVERLIVANIPGPYKINSDCVIKTIDPVLSTPPKNAKRYYTAYAAACGYAVVSRADGTEQDLFVAYQKVMRRALQCEAEYGGKEITAALIIYTSKSIKSVKLQKSICELLGVSHAKFAKHQAQLGL